MSELVLTSNSFDPDGYWYEPIAKLTYIPTPEDFDLFDQNGYDLTEIEKHFASSNLAGVDSHRSHRTALKQPWFTQPTTIEGAHLNHSLLFERKGYIGQALSQLKAWARDIPLAYKLVNIRPKWGLDFSMDYADSGGNVFEVLHWEWDSFTYEEIMRVKSEVEPILSAIDWQDASAKILAKKDLWHYLSFFEQSEWKCKYFGITNERFKMVLWS